MSQLGVAFPGEQRQGWAWAGSAAPPPAAAATPAAAAAEASGAVPLLAVQDRQDDVEYLASLAGGDPGWQDDVEYLASLAGGDPGWLAGCVSGWLAG